jgi:hypothetical protein
MAHEILPEVAQHNERLMTATLRQFLQKTHRLGVVGTPIAQGRKESVFGSVVVLAWLNMFRVESSRRRS